MRDEIMNRLIWICGQLKLGYYWVKYGIVKLYYYAFGRLILPEPSQKVRDYVIAGNNIEAIKAYRKETGLLLLPCYVRIKCLEAEVQKRKQPEDQ